MKNPFKLTFALLLFAMVFAACSDDDSDSDVNINNPQDVKQVDMTVVVPIHPSSLEYFDYVIHYYDNQGLECRDTIQGSQGGIVVEDSNYVDIEDDLYNTRTALTINNCYLRTFSYDNLSVSCTVNVDMLPKMDDAFMEDFIFYIPKPYIFPNVRDSLTPPENIVPHRFLEEVESIRVEPMTVKSFQDAYGTSYSSQCVVDGSLDE